MKVFAQFNYYDKSVNNVFVYIVVKLIYSSKIYMTIENLFAMFAKKQFRKSLIVIHKRIRFSTSDQI